MEMTPLAFPELQNPEEKSILSKRSHSQAKLSEMVSSQPSVFEEKVEKSQKDLLMVNAVPVSKNSNVSDRNQDQSKRMTEKTSARNPNSRKSSFEIFSSLQEKNLTYLKEKKESDPKNAKFPGLDKIYDNIGHDFYSQSQLITFTSNTHLNTSHNPATFSKETKINFMNNNLGQNRQNLIKSQNPILKKSIIPTPEIENRRVESQNLYKDKEYLNPNEISQINVSLAQNMILGNSKNLNNTGYFTFGQESSKFNVNNKSGLPVTPNPNLPNKIHDSKMFCSTGPVIHQIGVADYYSPRVNRDRPVLGKSEIYQGQDYIYQEEFNDPGQNNKMRMNRDGFNGFQNPSYPHNIRYHQSDQKNKQSFSFNQMREGTQHLTTNINNNKNNQSEKGSHYYEKILHSFENFKNNSSLRESPFISREKLRVSNSVQYRDSLNKASHSSGRPGTSNSIKSNTQKDKNYFKRLFSHEFENCLKPKQKPAMKRKRNDKKLKGNYLKNLKSEDENFPNIPTQSFKHSRLLVKQKPRFFGNSGFMNSKKTEPIVRESLESMSLGPQKFSKPKKIPGKSGQSEEVMNSMLNRINSLDDKDELLNNSLQKSLKINFNLNNSKVKEDGKDCEEIHKDQVIRQQFQNLKKNPNKLMNFDFHSWNLGKSKSNQMSEIRKNEIEPVIKKINSRFDFNNLQEPDKPRIQKNIENRPKIFPSLARGQINGRGPNKLLKTSLSRSLANRFAISGQGQQTLNNNILNHENSEYQTQLEGTQTYLAQSGFEKSIINSRNSINPSLICGSMKSKLNLNNSLIPQNQQARLNFSQSIKGNNQSGIKKRGSCFGAMANCVDGTKWVGNTSICEKVNAREQLKPQRQIIECGLINEAQEDQHSSSMSGSMVQRRSMSGQKYSNSNRRQTIILNKQDKNENEVHQNPDHELKNDISRNLQETFNLKTKNLDGSLVRDEKQQLHMKSEEVRIYKSGDKNFQSPNLKRIRTEENENNLAISKKSHFHKVKFEENQKESQQNITQKKPSKIIPKLKIPEDEFQGPIMPSQLSFKMGPKRGFFRDQSQQKKMMDGTQRINSLSRSSKWKLFNDGSPVNKKDDSIFSYKKNISISNRNIEKLNQEPDLRGILLHNQKNCDEKFMIQNFFNYNGKSDYSSEKQTPKK